MKKIFLIIGCAAVLLGGGAWLYSQHAAPATPAQPPYVVPALTQSYSNAAYNFSLKMPANFTASDIPSSDPSAPGDTIVLQNTADQGIQIIVSPFDDDTSGSYTLTQARILQDVPNLTITNPQPVVVGPNYTGLAFESDNAAFGGASREVWFVFHGNLYQISTYARLDGLLKAIFGTWQFQS